MRWMWPCSNVVVIRGSVYTQVPRHWSIGSSYLLLVKERDFGYVSDRLSEMVVALDSRQLRRLQWDFLHLFFATEEMQRTQRKPPNSSTNPHSQKSHAKPHIHSKPNLTLSLIPSQITLPNAWYAMIKVLLNYITIHYFQVKAKNPVWDCATCYAVFHLKCISQWYKSSSTASANEWRCPGCQSITTLIPNVYRCFCKKAENPALQKFVTPHSCGSLCGKDRGCAHGNHFCFKTKFNWYFSSLQSLMPSWTRWSLPSSKTTFQMLLWKTDL